MLLNASAMLQFRTQCSALQRSRLCRSLLCHHICTSCRIQAKSAGRPWGPGLKCIAAAPASRRRFASPDLGACSTRTCSQVGLHGKERGFFSVGRRMSPRSLFMCRKSLKVPTCGRIAPQLRTDSKARRSGRTISLLRLIMPAIQAQPSRRG